MNANINDRISRRLFLLSVTTGLAAPALGHDADAAQSELNVMKPGDVERLRLDFNTNRAHVRLMAVLSPT